MDELASSVWVGSLRLVPGIEEQVALEEVDEIAG